MAVSRASLLRGMFRSNEAVIRPPWALADGFEDACDGCGRCVPACPEGILRLDRARTAVAEFSTTGCTLCGACAEVCPTGALNRTEERPAFPHVARVGAGCLSLSGVDCRMCHDHCDGRAIRFDPLGRGRWVPSVMDGDCTGCGACLPVCPVKAISLTGRDGTKPA